MNIKTASLLIALPALLTVACDDLPDAYDPEALEVADVDDDRPDLEVDDLAVMQPTHAPLAVQIAQHPAFGQFTQRAWSRIGAVLAAKSTMTHAELQATYAVFERCRTMSGQICQDTLAAGAFTTALNGTELQLRNQLNTSFHLDNLSVPDRTALLRAAQDAYIAAGGAKPPLSLVPTSYENGLVACPASCQSSILAGMDLAHGGMMARMASTNPSESSGDSGDGGNGGWIAVLTGIAIAAGEQLIECWISNDCHAWPEQNPNNPPPECTDNGDCDSDEYCWKGPLGIGENECRDKKANGVNCGNDDACLSGCCNFNLFGSECAQPSKCN